LVAQNHEQPCANIRAGAQKTDARNGPLQRFVNQVIGLIRVPAQQDSESTKLRYYGQHGVSMNSGPDTNSLLAMSRPPPIRRKCREHS
jgi:hypothetical protein